MILSEIFEGGISGILKGAKEIISSLKADPLEVARLNAAMTEAELKVTSALIQAQAQINAIEAGSGSWFKSNWRPAAGWTCVGGLAYQVVARPILQSIINIWHPEFHAVTLEMDTLLTILFGMLGLGAYRTYERTVK